MGRGTGSSRRSSVERNKHTGEGHQDDVLNKPRQPRTVSIESIERKLASLQDERNRIFEQIIPLQERAAKLYHQIQRLQEKRDRLIISGRDDPEAIDFGIIMGTGPSVSRVMADERDRQLEKLSLRSGGYWSDTNQTCIQIALTKGDEVMTRAVFDGLRKVLPHIIPNDQNERRVDIFDHRLSADGGWKLAILGPDEHSEVVLKNGRFERQMFNDLWSALKHCEQHNWDRSDDENDEG
jgi:hypothetical protein